MARHLSISQIDLLGVRLRQSEAASSSDRDLLRRFIADYAEPMRLVQNRLRSRHGLHSTSRLKTEKSIIEKLRRERTRLSRMQDIAGVRVVITGTRLEHADTLGTSRILEP